MLRPGAKRRGSSWRCWSTTQQEANMPTIDLFLPPETYPVRRRARRMSGGRSIPWWQHGFWLRSGSGVCASAALWRSSTTRCCRISVSRVTMLRANAASRSGGEGLRRGDFPFSSGRGNSAHRAGPCVLIHPDMACRCDLHALIGISVQLVAQRADRDAEDVRRVRTVAAAVLQGLENQFALDIRDRPSDERCRTIFIYIV